MPRVLKSVFLFIGLVNLILIGATTFHVPVEAAPLSCTALQSQLTTATLNLTRLNALPINSPEFLRLYSAVNNFDTDDIQKQCGSKSYAEAELANAWKLLIETRQTLQYTQPEPGKCYDVDRAKNQNLLLDTFFYLNNTVQVILPLVPDYKNLPQYIGLKPLLSALEHSTGLRSIAFDRTDASEKFYKTQYGHAFIRAAATAPSTCSTPIVPALAASIKTAGQGPTLYQTIAWLEENLPTSYTAITSFGLISQNASYDFGSYDINPCAMYVHIDTINPRPFFNSSVPSIPIYIVNIEAASQTVTGQPVSFGSNGIGIVDFNQVQPQSIAIQVDDAGSNLMPISLGFKNFSTATRDLSLANRLLTAFHRLATLCGAKDDPF